MPSRQDQLHSYQFMVQRVVSALVMRDTDPTQSPFRRAMGSTLASVLVAVVIMAGFGVYSIFTGRGSTQWQQDGYVVIEKETGATFLYRGVKPNHKLHPVLNYTSALLASGSPGRVARNVPTKSLLGIPRGFPIGITELPDTLPAVKDGLLGMPWSACTIRSGDTSSTSALAVGDTTIASSGQQLSAGQGFLVQAADGDTFLLTRDKLHQLTGPAKDVALKQNPPIRVSLAFIKATPRGQAFALPEIKDLGKPSPAMRNVRQNWVNGQVFRLRNPADPANIQFAVVQSDRYELITQFQASQMLRMTDGKPGFATVSQEITETELTGVTKRDVRPRRDDPQQPPAESPNIMSTASGLCAVFRDEKGAAEIRYDVPLDLAGRTRTQRRSTVGAIYADYVIVPPTKGALVQTGQTFGLVTDQGMRFQAAKPEVLSLLGYGGRAPLKLRPELVSLVPEGPGLDPDKVLIQFGPQL